MSELFNAALEQLNNLKLVSGGKAALCLRSCAFKWLIFVGLWMGVEYLAKGFVKMKELKTWDRFEFLLDNVGFYWIFKVF
jgi:hypothetical protein